MSNRVRSATLAAIMAGLALSPTAAWAWWRGGVWVGPGYGYPPPVVYAPPVYAPPVYAPPVYAPPVYAPPPVVYAPPPTVYNPQVDAAAQAASLDGQCVAGAYVCPLDRPLNVGAPCSCPGNRGRIGGTVRR